MRIGAFLVGGTGPFLADASFDRAHSYMPPLIAGIAFSCASSLLIFRLGPPASNAAGAASQNG